ncbi:MAG: cell division protein FtsZ [Candidatus Eisenbacteria bacterium]|uniref:Cell division protein FtsZ n=1 Tax=Eiseniibacteriota bacterium TaxID=2212470 RepID=A0A7Y2H0W1_UNCEI|nr:cell division protein FtsZ [Candidatus Eisenbacteria bacterium]
MLELVEPKAHAVLRVVGCGGAGGNAVNGMVQGGLGGVEFMAMNSDAQALEGSLAPTKIQLGTITTQGLGCGGKPEMGRQAAEESCDEIRECVRGADMVFVTAGMGGGTGTGSAPVVARIAREEGALTVAVVSKPFLFEGRRRGRQAEEGLAALRQEVDTLIVIPNQRLLAVADRDTSLVDGFRRADEVLFQGVRGISDLITVPGLINLDFADVKSVMGSRGNALMGTGFASGESKAEEAARQAISSPLLEDVSIAGAEAVLVNICGGEDLGLHTVTEAMDIVNEAVGDDANVIFGSVIDPEMSDALRLTVIATGFGKKNEELHRGDARSMAAKAPITESMPQPKPVAPVVSSPVGRPAPAPSLSAGASQVQDINNPRWERAKKAPNLDVPTFIRKQMD